MHNLWGLFYNNVLFDFDELRRTWTFERIVAILKIIANGNAKIT